jgi:hypothetical protein
MGIVDRIASVRPIETTDLDISLVSVAKNLEPSVTILSALGVECGPEIWPLEIEFHLGLWHVTHSVQ